MSGELLRPFRADLHIHSCLSPCAEIDMSPKKIVEQSIAKGLDIIALCDHNSVENAEAVRRVGKREGLAVLPGMEICSKEEVHVLAIFKDAAQALIMQEYVYAHLPGTNRADIFGDQIIVDENNIVVGENPHLLIMATRLGLSEIMVKIHSLEGIGIASHVDRPAYGIINKLGFIPPDLAFDGMEISRHISSREAKIKYKEMGLGSKPFITSSDAHIPEDIGKAWTRFIMTAPTLAEIRLALQKKDGRRVELQR